MTFKELYDDLEQYISDCELRWKHVMRVKRYHTDNKGLGGYGGDQCYLEGHTAKLSVYPRMYSVASYPSLTGPVTYRCESITTYRFVSVNDKSTEYRSSRAHTKLATIYTWVYGYFFYSAQRSTDFCVPITARGT